MKRKLLLILILLSGYMLLPSIVFAKVYNVLNEDDRNGVQQIFPEATFDSSSSYKPSVGVKKRIEKGDTIYFENTNGWSDVKIYIYEDKTGEKPVGGDWAGFAMTNTDTQINGHDIYKFQYTNEETKYNYVIFSGLDSSSVRKQTIDLAYLEKGAYYSCNSYTESDGKYKGNWFVYDKSTIKNFIDALSDLDSYKDVIDTTSYNKLKELYNSANEMMPNTEIIVTYYDYDHTLYISDYIELIYEFDNAFNNLIINTSELENAINNASNLDTSVLSDSEKHDFENLIQEANDFKDLVNSGSPFHLLINTSIDDFNSQADGVGDIIDQMNDLIDRLKLSINNINEKINNANNNYPVTGDNIIKYIILFIVSAFGLIFSITYKKIIKNN